VTHYVKYLQNGGKMVRETPAPEVAAVAPVN
jgi:hypothetical protein